MSICNLSFKSIGSKAGKRKPIGLHCEPALLSLPSPAAMQTFGVGPSTPPPPVKLENKATLKAINFLQTHVCWWPQYQRQVADLVQGSELAGAASLKTDLGFANLGEPF